MYVGFNPHDSDRLGEEKREKGNEKEENNEKKGKRENRQVEDGLLLVAPTRIYRKSVRVLIATVATGCFLTPSCIATVGLKGIPCDIFLELGNGEKYLSRGYVADVPMVLAGLIVKIGLTVTLCKVWASWWV